jgi:hypothetical protein
MTTEVLLLLRYALDHLDAVVQMADRRPGRIAVGLLSEVVNARAKLREAVKLIEDS